MSASVPPPPVDTPSPLLSSAGTPKRPSVKSRLALIAATLLGIGLAVWLVRSIGWAAVAEAARQMGVGGFLILCLYSLGLFVLLGAAWGSAAGESARRVPLFTAARIAREATSDFLPISQLGGMAVGAHVATSGGVGRARVYASMIVDQATEMASQLVFTLAGIALAGPLLLGGGGAALHGAIAGSALVALAMLLAILFGQRRFLRLATRIAAGMLPAASDMLGQIEAELGRLYACRSRVALSFLFNLAAWLATAGASWLILRLIGHPLAFWRLVSIESVISIMRSAAFLVPGAIGLQEAAYVVVGPVLGLAAGPALALSLAKRARDGVLALVGLAGWSIVVVGRRIPR